MDEQKQKYVGSGSYAAGFLLGFFLGLGGLILGVYEKKSETERGAITGFSWNFGITIIVSWIVIYILSLFGLLPPYVRLLP